MERKEAITNREREAWRLRLLGWTQDRIATHLGVAQPAICKALARTERRLAQQFAAEALEAKARQTAQLEALYESLMDEWERSCEAAEKVTVTTGRTQAAEGALIALPDVVTTVRSTQTGNPALIARAMDALASIRAIWGLESPARSELSGPGGTPIPVVREICVELGRAEGSS